MTSKNDGRLSRKRKVDKSQPEDIHDITDDFQNEIQLEESNKLVTKKSKKNSFSEKSDYITDNGDQKETGLCTDDESLQFIQDLEKTVCSESEKLCSVCKCIVPATLFSSHIKECIQRFSVGKKKLLADSSTNLTNSSDSSERVLLCSICYKHFQTAKQRSLHIKSCANAHGVSSSKLIIASRLQEKLIEERANLGIPFAKCAGSVKEKKIGQRVHQNFKGKKDDDFETAMALSKSLTEEEVSTRCNQENILSDLGMFDIVEEERLTVPCSSVNEDAFRVLPTRGACKRKKQTKRNAIILSTRTSSDRERIISEKVASLLADEHITNNWSSAFENKMSKSALEKFHDHHCSLWNAHTWDTSEPVENYFVCELKDFIKPKHVPVGALLKHFSQIPGRLNTTEKIEDEDAEAYCTNFIGSDMNHDDLDKFVVDSYCTQLALAKLIEFDDENTFGNLPAFHEDPGHSLVKNCLFNESAENTDEIEVKNFNYDSNSTLWSVSGEESNKKQKIEHSVKNMNKEIRTLIETSKMIDQDKTDCREGLIILNKLNCSSGPCNVETVSSHNSEPSVFKKFVKDWTSFLIEGNHSDIEIITKNNNKIKAHKLIMQARCPLLHSEACKGDILWPNVTYEGAVQFMLYLYTGQFNINFLYKETYLLAEKYECIDLLEHLINIFNINDKINNSLIINDYFSEKDQKQSHSLQEKESFACEDSPKNLINSLSDENNIAETLPNPESPDFFEEDILSEHASPKMDNDKLCNIVANQSDSDNTIDLTQSSGQKTDGPEDTLEHNENLHINIAQNREEYEEVNKEITYCTPSFRCNTNRCNNTNEEHVNLSESCDAKEVYSPDDSNGSIDLTQSSGEQSGKAEEMSSGNALNSSPKNDIWEDFDDTGVMYPVAATLSEEEIKTNTSHHCSANAFSFSNSHGNFSIGDDTLIKATENLEDDKIAISASVANEVIDSVNKRLTPIVNMKRKKFEHLDVTPMLDYKTMVTPELQKELDKFGIRKISKKKAILLLTHIYEQLHPLVTDSELDEEDSVTTPVRKSSKIIEPVRRCIAKKFSKSDNRIKENKKPNNQLNAPSLSSQYSDSSMNSSDSEYSEELLSSQDSCASEISSSQKVSTMTAVHNYITSNPELHEKILLYEPIKFEEFHADLKANGIKFSKKALMDYLDEQCITFRLEQNFKRSRRRRKK